MHLGSFDGSREKCVDIALAVDMLHYATVPGAFDVAVLVSGDADFLPALVRTRQRGKRVAICSLRNSASSSFENAEASQLLGLVADGEAREIGPPSLSSRRRVTSRPAGGRRRASRTLTSSGSTTT